jgi:hypothetical protein
MEKVKITRRLTVAFGRRRDNQPQLEPEVFEQWLHRAGVAAQSLLYR